MAESPPESPKSPTRSPNRWSIGALAAIQLLLLTACVLAVNYLSALRFWRLDLTRGADYTLSSSTTGYLSSKALSGREAPVKWIVAVKRTNPLFDRIHALAEEYSRLSGRKIQVETLDTLRSPDCAAQVMAAYELVLAEDLVIIDGRTGNDSAVTTNKLGTRELNPHVKFVTAAAMMSHETGRDGQSRPNGFTGEDLLTASLVEAIEGKPRVMLFLSDKSRIDAQGEDSPWHTLENLLRLQNIQLKAVTLADLETIPGDVAGVALVAPQYDLTDAEAATLERYWSRQRAAFLVLLEPGHNLPKLRSFLRAYGITPRNDIIVTRAKDGQLSTQVVGMFSYAIDFISDLAGHSSIFEGSSSSLEVREGANDLLTHQIRPWSLFQTDAKYWGETEFGKGGEAPDKIKDFPGPLTLAASVAQGDMSDEKNATNVSRMVVIANTAFLLPVNRRAENLDFLASSANWLVGRDALAGARARSLGVYKLPLLDAQITFINRINFFLLPAFFVALGLMVWSSRRV